MSTFQYMKNLIKDRNIASITPTSKSGVKEVCERIDFSKRVVIVEYGPATGVFTKYLLEQMTNDSLLIAVELNENFAETLQKNITDSRLHVYQESAENIDEIMEKHGGEKADYVISGIPFSLMNSELRQSIVRKTKEVLKSEGKFLPYQTFFQKDEHLKNYLTSNFNDVQEGFIIKNLPPMRLYEAVK
ncbi:methyltransferase domain-containing protein [Bacillus lacus]|uniref:Methyltransferase domain-containing protein n=1 Tax=Metabacillus lacus TaxID=1983721 RepID=A0A7X2IZ83_9BACI|nr:methyltransferase domain-containing protein [Metabacillus lacus]MRX72222.1 methyltransferase domain-containing protein [Metabacillus lacus]